MEKAKIALEAMATAMEAPATPRGGTQVAGAGPKSSKGGMATLNQRLEQHLQQLRSIDYRLDILLTDLRGPEPEQEGNNEVALANPVPEGSMNAAQFLMTEIETTERRIANHTEILQDILTN